MWEYDRFIRKAKIYFDRAREHPSADDGVQPLWLLLGLEFLLRAPLAKVHPALLADPTGDAVMYACGYPMKPGSPQPKSIQTKTVINRLGVVIAGFDKEQQEDALLLTALRNEELHGGESPLEIAHHEWLPHFTRVAVAICEHLKLPPAEFIGDEIITQGLVLVDQEDRRIGNEISKRIAAASNYFARTLPDEAARKAASPNPLALAWKAGIEDGELINCPACGCRVLLQLRAVRTTNERLVADEILRDVVYIATGLTCEVCRLKLNGTAEIRAAGIEQQYIKTLQEGIEERFGASAGLEYGTD